MANAVERERHGIPVRAMIPNAITLLALCFGLTGVSLAIGGEWEKALGAVVFAGVLDGFDGRIARLLRAQSRFGAELDSLSDNIAFGTAPALIVVPDETERVGADPLPLVIADRIAFRVDRSPGARRLLRSAACTVQREDRRD